MEPITKQLVDLVEQNGWESKFDEAIKSVKEQNITELSWLNSFSDYCSWIDDQLHWAPHDPDSSRLIYHKICQSYYLLDQEPLKSLQTPVKPGEKQDELSPLSQWIKDFANAWGAYLDTDESAKEVQSFYDDPLFNMNDYMPMPSGWKTFNQFFARHTKPGKRPVAALNDPSVLVSPTDSTFVGWWQVDEESKIFVESKGLRWSIEQLLEGSEYADRFKGGIFTHSFLNTFDYHRWHTPVPGKVVEARVIQGQAYLDVDTVPGPIVDGKQTNILNALDGTGYQFVQTRGLAVIDSPVGLVALLPMGMAEVSSVTMTAEVGVTLHKGEEFGYFQFGGSDFVMVFEQASNVHLFWQPGVHVRQGTAIGQAYGAY